MASPDYSYERANEKWPLEEIQRLEREVTQGYTIDEMSERHQRSPNAISSKLYEAGIDETYHVVQSFLNEHISPARARAHVEEESQFEVEDFDFFEDGEHDENKAPDLEQKQREKLAERAARQMDQSEKEDKPDEVHFVEIELPEHHKRMVKALVVLSSIGIVASFVALCVVILVLG